MRCKMCFNILNRLDVNVACECDGQSILKNNQLFFISDYLIIFT